MKTAALIISLLLASCRYATEPVAYIADTDTDNAIALTALDETGESGLVSIAYLKTLAAGRSTFISGDLYIQGSVAAHDWLGEFYKTMTLVDDSGGIEISVDSRHIWQLLPLHSSVTVSCNGLTLGRYGNKMLLGTASSDGDYPAERIPEQEFYRYISVSGEASMPDPIELEVGEFSTAHISRFVCFRNLQPADEERGAVWCDDTDDDTDEEDDDDRFLKFTDRHFVDQRGDTLTVRILNRCDYAQEPIPSGRMVLAGIADADADTPLLRIANRYIWPM